MATYFENHLTYVVCFFCTLTYRNLEKVVAESLGALLR